MIRPLSHYGNRCGTSPHVFTGAQASPCEMWIDQVQVLCACSVHAQLSSGDLGFTADVHRVLEA